MSPTKVTTSEVRVEVLIPFAESNLAPFRRGETFNAPSNKVQDWLNGGLVRLAPADAKPVERAVALPLRSKA